MATQQAKSPSSVRDATDDPPSPPSPTASFYDMSDDEEGYNTIKHTKMEKGVKLLYAKSKVYIHPTPSAKDNIPGYVALLQQKPEDPTSPGSSSGRASDRTGLLLAWVPESGLGKASETYSKVEIADSDEPPKQTNLVPRPPITTTHSASLGNYAFAIPLSEIFSIQVRPPSVGWWFGSIILNSRAGDSFPALFFHDSECQSTISQRKRHQRENFDISSESGGMFWGGDETLRWLKRYVTVERSTQEHSIYLIDPSETDKVSFGSGGKPTPDKVRNALENKPRGQPGPKGQDGDPVTQALKQARWSFLEKMVSRTCAASLRYVQEARRSGHT